MRRRGFLQLFGLGAISTVLPLPALAKFKAKETALESGFGLAAIKTEGSFTKALWPGINAWYEKAYKEHLYEQIET